MYIFESKASIYVMKHAQENWMNPTDLIISELGTFGIF